MRFVITCLIGVALLASPCVYDSDPREPSAVAAMITGMSSPSMPFQVVGLNKRFTNQVSATAP